MAILGTDADGKLGKDGARPEKYHKIIRPQKNTRPTRKRKWGKTSKHMERTWFQ